MKKDAAHVSPPGAARLPLPGGDGLSEGERSSESVVFSQSSANNPQLPPPIPDHELLRPIGRGSYGAVWLARNVVGTSRAVKIVYRKTFENDRPYEREYAGIQKFEPISRSHEGFVDILQIGRNDAAGCFYYVMELADDANAPVAAEVARLTSPGARVSPPVAASDSQRVSGDSERLLLGEGAAAGDSRAPKSEPPHVGCYAPRTLRSEIQRRTRLSFDDCVALGLSLARALAHLHAHGLVHRDIKPSNIIFVGGVPKLADIGLVTDAGEARSYVGTEGFIPPEGPGTPAADLFSLGKVLYEASTGKDRQDFPEPLTNLGDQPDKDRLLELNAILHRACAPDTRVRYPSAEAMVSELELLQAGQSVRRARTHHRRRTLFVKLVAALAVSAVMAVGGTAFLRHLAESSINPSDRLSKNPLANKAYLEGVHCARRDTTEGFSQGVAHFKRAIEIDPSFAMAYNGLYEIYVAEPGPSSRACVEKMMELEPNLAEAHAGLGYLDFLDWNWEQAEPHFLKAIELNPRCAIAHMRYGFCLVSAGSTDDGYRELRAAENLNPTSPRIKKNLGHVFYVRRQFREAMAQYQKAIDLEPSYPTSHNYIGYCYRALGNYTNAMDEMEHYGLVTAKDPAAVRQRFEELRRAYAKEGPRGYWLKKLEQVDPTEPWGIYWKAQAYAHLDDYDRALDSLAKQFEQPAVESLNWLIRDECWDPVHDDPRFVALLRLVGFRK